VSAIRLLSPEHLDWCQQQAHFYYVNRKAILRCLEDGYTQGGMFDPEAIRSEMSELIMDITREFGQETARQIAHDPYKQAVEDLLSVMRIRDKLKGIIRD